MNEDERQVRRERARRRTRRERAAAFALLTGLAVTGGTFLFLGLGGSDASTAEAGGNAPVVETTSRQKTVRAERAQLPRGGQKIFPRYRIVGFYGAPQSEELGTLGIGTPAAAARRLQEQARPYRSGGRPTLPAFELLAAIASSGAGDDGLYRFRQDPDVIRRYLRAARQAKALLVLDLQPGRADFLSETKALRTFLEQPDVGLALDPEWHMDPGEVPGESIGSTDAATVNKVSAYLAAIVRRKRLPQKLLIVHQFTASMIENKRAIVQRPEVAVVINVDGFGSQAAKISKYKGFTRGAGRFFNGLKLFYEEDVDVMQPSEVLGLRPPPDVVIYE